MNPAPGPYHQLVSIRLAHQLMSRIADRGLGTVLASPIDVHLGPGSLVQPDLVAIRHRNRSIVGAVKVTGVPDLMIEILSPRTRWHDRHRKSERYERAGVREFWIVDPEAGCIEQFVLRKGRFAAPVVATSAITLRVFRGVVLDLTEVW